LKGCVSLEKINYQEFYRYDELVKFLENVSDNKKDFCKLISLADTRECRKLYLLEVTDYSTGKAEGKSAYYVQANVHSNESAGTMAALHLINSLLYCDEYKELLKKVTFYIVPRVNPDGAELALTTHAPIRSRLEATDRRNGLVPEDLNGDGMILNMRWEDPTGRFVEDEIDKRIMVTRRPGDKGPFYKLHTEGIISNYDGTSITDGCRHFDFNRNYPENWDNRMEVAGAYPFSEIETRAVGDFLISHPNIFAAIDLHCGTPAILRPSFLSDNDMDQADLSLILEFGKAAEKLIGFPLMRSSDYRQPWQKPDILPGNSIDWFYKNLGIFGYTIELGWGLSSAGIFGNESFVADSRTRETTFMRKVLEFHDSKGSKIFTPWQEFEHPQLGKVEIGGLMTGNARFMYPPDMEEISPRVTEFLTKHAEQHPELIICNIEKESPTEGIYRIRATVGNIGGLSTRVMNGGGGFEKKIPVKTRILSEDNIEILNQILVYEVDNLAALGDSYKQEWFIKGKPGDNIIIETFQPKAGMKKVEIIL